MLLEMSSSTLLVPQKTLLWRILEWIHGIELQKRTNNSQKMIMDIGLLMFSVCVRI